MNRQASRGIRRGGGWAAGWLATGLIGLACLVPSLAHAATVVDLDDRVREIASELRCVVCQNLSVADSPSDLAKEMRGLVRELVQQGKSREEIEAYFVSRYGQFVLLSPPKQGFNLLVWVLPFLAVAVGAGVVYLVARHWTEAAPAGRPPVDPAYAERVRRELRDREGR